MTTKTLEEIWDKLKIEPLTTQDEITNTSGAEAVMQDNTYSWSTDTITLGSITGATAMSAGAGMGIYTIDNTTGINTTWNSPYIFQGTGTNTNSGQIQLRGDNADIVVNGRSLMDAIDDIEKRLNILRPNPDLEKEWDQLRELGEQYRKLEQELKEKSKMWGALKQMPPPEIP